MTIFLFGPALKARFLLTDAYVYLAPTGIFLSLLVISTLAIPRLTFSRLHLSLLFLLPFFPCYYAWFSDTSQLSLLIIIAINCAIGVAIVIFPWNDKALDDFLRFCAFIGAGVAISLLLNLGTYEALQDASEIERRKSLSIATTLGIACLASLYLLSNRLSMVYAGLFVINWIALAASRGRGAVLVCAAVTVVYLLILYFSKISTLSRIKKTLIIIGAISITPVVISKLFALSSGKWNRLLFEFDTEVDEGGRGHLMGTALKQIQESPLLGNGLGQYAADSGHPHNIILQFGVDSGFVGICFLLVFFYVIASRSIASINQSSQEKSNLSLAMAALFAFIIGNYLKSGDPYIGRDWYILSAFPLATSFLLSRNFSSEYKLERGNLLRRL